jgi:hypothetical protein
MYCGTLINDWVRHLVVVGSLSVGLALAQVEWVMMLAKAGFVFGESVRCSEQDLQRDLLLRNRQALLLLGGQNMVVHHH